MLTRGINYIHNGRYDKALAVLKKEAKRNPNGVVELYLGCAHMGLGNDALAERHFINAMSGRERIGAIQNLGLLYYYYERDDDAVTTYRIGLEESPDWGLIWNYCITRLRQYMSDKYFDLKYCWQLYETRFQIPDAVGLGAKVNWTGGTKVDSITVLAEQGIGDNLMFARYLPEVKKWCDRLVIECAPELNCIFSGYETRNTTGMDTTHSIPMCSLGNLLDEIPDGEWLGGWKGGSGKIGFVWKSSNKHNNNTYRNTTVDGLLGIDGLCSLGPDCRDSRLEHLPSSTWEETVETLKTIDMVVAVDTAIVHLCGIMGVPCLVLMPYKNSDWRWGDSSCGENNKWYRSVRVIRNHQNWDDVFQKVRDIIARSKQTGDRP